MTDILIAYKEQAWTTEAAFLASTDAPAERVLVWALDTGRAWLGDGSTLPASLTPVVYPAIPLSYLDTDTTMAADSNSKVPSQHAVKTLIASSVAGLLDYKGGIDCSANPNYPAALRGDTYFVTVAGKIGGASGTSVDVSDMIVANADNAGGTEASVGTSWNHFEHNLVGALLAANNLSDVGSASAALANLGGAPSTRNVSTGTGLTGGGNLTADRTLSIDTSVTVDKTTAQALSNKDLTSGTNTFPTFNQNTSGTAANLSGTPALPNGTTATTQSAADNSTKLATTAYVDSGLSLKAPLASPTFTGTPAAPTAAQGTNTTQIATTAMVHSEAVLLAPLASPTFTGTVTLPTGLTGPLVATSGVVSTGFVSQLTATATLSNNAAETTLWTATNYTGAITSGVTNFRFHLVGTLDNAASSGLLDVRLKINATTVVTVGLISTSQTSGATGTQYGISGSMWVDTSGASGVVTMGGDVTCLTTAGGGQNPRPFTVVSGTINLTGGIQLTVTGDWATAALANTLRLTRGVINQVA